MKRRSTKPVAGSYSIVIQPRPSKRWADPGTPEFDPNWVVRFNMPGKPVKAESSRLPVCEDCVSDRAVNKALRASCGCRKPALEWANAKLQMMAELWHQGRLDELDAMTKPKTVKRLKLATVVEVYSKCSLDAATDNIASLKLFYEASTGRKLEDGFVDELTPALTRRFAAIYQEYGRRGWNKRGTAPVDAWAQLRSLEPLPAIDWKTAASWNTTIKSTLARVKSIFGPDAREKYIHSVADELPDLSKFRECSMGLPRPDNREAMSQESYQRLLDALPALLAQDARMWLLIRLAMVTGLRSVELLAIRRDWIEVDPTGTVLLVMKQRHDFRLKDRESRQVREIPLPEDVLAVMRKVTTPSVYSVETASAIDALYRRVNSWLRTGGYVAADSDQVLYVVGRKTKATAQARTHGLQSAADALGHSTTNTTANHYVDPTVRVTALTEAEMVSALQAGRTAWTGGKEK